MRATACRQRSEEDLVESVLPIHLFVSSGDPTEVTRPVQQVPLPTDPSCQPPKRLF